MRLSQEAKVLNDFKEQWDLCDEWDFDLKSFITKRKWQYLDYIAWYYGDKFCDKMIEQVNKYREGKKWAKHR